MEKDIKITTLSIILTIFCLFSLKAQNYNIDYFGVSASDVDANMLKMTSDLYYTQLCEIQNFNVTDKRSTITENTIPEKDKFEYNTLGFYAVITKNESDNDSWASTLHVYNKNYEKEFSKTKEYDSFYKILMESKNTLQSSIKDLIENNQTSVEAAKKDEQDNKVIPKVSSDSLSGNWTGESYIDKIVVMRGGRGFVIFKNGASMNINIAITNTEAGQSITVTQKGNSNASFFPDLPRNIALKAAVSAEPIVWKFSVTDSNTITGTKKTLVAQGDSYTYAEVDVIWKRSN